MSDEILNDNEDIAGGPGRSFSGQKADEHGRAAILLVESLIHGLVARSVINVADALEIVEIAADAGIAIADGLGDDVNPRFTSRTLIAAIGASLRLDLPEMGGEGDPNLDPDPQKRR